MWRQENQRQRTNSQQRQKERGLAVKVSKLMDEKYKWSQGIIVELTAINLAN